VKTILTVIAVVAAIYMLIVIVGFLLDPPDEFKRK
jgi:hypothetical protein